MEQNRLTVFKDIMLEIFDDKSMAIMGIVAIVLIRALAEIPNEIVTAAIGAMAVMLGKPKAK